MTSAFNPSDLIDKFYVLADGSTITAGATVNSDARIDTSKYRHLLVLFSAGAIASDLTVTVLDSDVASAGTTTTVSSFTVLAASHDNDLLAHEVRCHGTRRFVEIQLAAAAGTNSAGSIVVLGVKARSSNELATLTDASAAIGMS